MTTKVKDDRAAKLALASKSFRYFLEEFVYVGDPPPAGEGVVKFQPWPHLMEMAETLRRERFIVWIKPRQIGATWEIAAYVDWMAQFIPYSTVLLFSQGEDEAKEFLSKVMTVDAYIPDWAKHPVLRGNLTEVYFANGSRVLAFPSTPTAGHGLSGTLAVFDEADFHEYLSQSYAAVYPVVADTGGQIVLLSKSNYATSDSPFKRLYREAPGNGYHRVFHPYWVRPGRDSAWYDENRRRAEDVAQFEKSYPRSDLEALAPARATLYFDLEAVEELLSQTREPRETELGLFSYWRPPAVAGRYVMGGDVAWGEKGAYSCVVVADFVTMEQVAELHGRPALDELAQMIVRLGRKYNDAYAVIEANGEGRSVVDKMVELGYGARMYWRPIPSAGKPQEPGWITGSSTRAVQLQDLAEAVRTLTIRPMSREGAGEFLTFVRDEKGHPGPARGAYADRVMAWALALIARSQAHFNPPQSTRRSLEPQPMSVVRR